MGDLFQWQPNPELTAATSANILCFGWNSAGKSTFINKVLSLISNAIRRAAAVRTGNESTTRGIDDFQLDNSRVKMFDSPGLAMDLYLQNEFAQILRGLAPREWTIGRQMTMPQGVDVSRFIYALIFFYPINSLDDPNSMARMRQIIDSSIRDYRKLTVFFEALLDSIEKYSLDF